MLIKLKNRGIFCVFLFLGGLSGCSESVKNSTFIDAHPQIFPDYTSLVIPANIAPLNFNIEEKGSEFLVEIYSEKGREIKIRQTSPTIIIPIKDWRKILNSNKGKTLKIEIYAKREGWYKYKTITDTIAAESIDKNLVYRLLGIIHTDGDKLGIYQRNLETFEQTTIFENNTNPKTPCVNCHSFSNNNADKMSMHVRKAYGGTVIFDNGKFIKYNTRTQQSIAPAAYTAWHPNGNLIAFSVNRLFVYFTSNEEKLVEVADQVSDLVLFNLKTSTLSSSEKISTPARENLPNWSSDGKWLYYISAPLITKNMSSWIDAKYDLLRISFNPEDMSWGEVDTLLTSRQTGKSITWPSASPDGRYVLFCMIDHSYFSIFDKNSDLYLLDLKTKQYKKAAILNSETTESYHSWSKNGKWLVFSSKRLDGVSTRPYLAYFDSTGAFHKPFILPQEDPLFYLNDSYNYNLPVFVKDRVKIDASEFQNFITENSVDASFDHSVPVDTSETPMTYPISH